MPSLSFFIYIGVSSKKTGHGDPLRSHPRVAHNGRGEAKSCLSGKGSQEWADEGREDFVMVSQFVMELQCLRTVDGEDPPRLKGNWSRKLIIERCVCVRDGSLH